MFFMTHGMGWSDPSHVSTPSCPKLSILLVGLFPEDPTIPIVGVLWTIIFLANKYALS